MADERALIAAACKPLFRSLAHHCSFITAKTRDFSDLESVAEDQDFGLGVRIRG